MPSPTSPRRFPFLSAAVLSVFALVLARAALADTIILKDGRQFDGTITRETPAEVTIETMISKIKAPMTFARSEIEKIIRGEPASRKKEDEKPADPKPEPPAKKTDPSSDPAESEDPFAADPKAPVPGAAGGTPYLVIPIRGVIGQDVAAFAIENCLKGAKSRGVKHIVFEIDSPGGNLGEALRISELLRRSDRDFVFHAFVDRKAISAATIFLAASRTIHMRPGSSTGAAVAFSRDRTTGAAEVDAKLNSAWAADLASTADRNGHPGCVFKAMVVMSERLYVWKDGDGFRFHDKAPNRDLKVTPTELDSDKTVFTFTAEEAAKWGFAPSVEGGPEALGGALNCDGWTSMGAAGAKTMEQGRRARAALTDRADEISKEMKTLLERLNDAKPDTDILVDERGKLTPQSARSWRDYTTRIDKYLKSLDDLIVESDKLDARLKAQGAEYLTPCVQVLRDDVNVRTLIKDKRDWLRKYRNSPPISK